MKRLFRTVTGLCLAAALTWGTAAGFFVLGVDKSIAAMALLLEVLGFAAVGDWLLAVLASLAATLAFSWYFIEGAGSFRINTGAGAITFLMMMFTALTGSRLSVRAQKRAHEAIRRREEMERLQKLGSVLLSAGTVSESARDVVGNIVELFGVGGAVLRLEGEEQPFEAGVYTAGPTTAYELNPIAGKSVLELHGVQPSAEVCNALVNLIKLVLDRARNAEDRARIETAQRGDELRSTILNALAHNFKTPLTSIKAAASMLRGSRDLPQAQSAELIAVIDEEADRLDQLIRESLDLARIEARQINPRFERCSFSTIVAHVSARVTRYLGGRELAVDVPEDLPPVIGDRFLLEQMLMQVIDNAWKYSQPGTHIHVTAAESETRLILTIQNEGGRIPADERERIFDKFYRGASNRSRVEGTGLGLAIAKAIAEAHGGTIWLDNEPDGPAFRFSLPLELTGETIDRQSDHTADRR
ncbi:MAG: ATP-binding protein [Terriglobia bacterium]